jgi:phosphoglycolate phosphatase-like HAD superfamily hydrolase
LLVLFDIDGTLLAGAGEAHMEALVAAMTRVHHVSVRMPPVSSRAGRTDGEIARLMLMEAGVSAERIDDRADHVQEACCREYAKRCPPDLSDKVVPGIPDVLTWLGERDGVKLGLLTGNFEPVARLKLKRAGVGHHFPARQGAFGSDSEDRTTLPAIARRRAGIRGRPHPREQTIVIGDTPRDIMCARADGVLAVAVATGPFPVDSLGDADAVAPTAPHLRRVLETLGC